MTEKLNKQEPKKIPLTDTFKKKEIKKIPLTSIYHDYQIIDDLSHLLNFKNNQKSDK